MRSRIVPASADTLQPVEILVFELYRRNTVRITSFVVAISPAVHAGNQAMSFQEILLIMAAVLRLLAGMNDQWVLGFRRDTATNRAFIANSL